MSKAKDPVPYTEDNPDHVPNPLYQSGVVDTTGTTGDLGGRIETISPVFQQAKADAFNSAVEAIDDPAVNEDEKIVFHDEDEHPSHEEQEQRIRDAAKDAQEAADAGLSPAQAEAAKTSDDEDDKSEPRKAPAKKAAAKKAAPAKA